MPTDISYLNDVWNVIAGCSPSGMRGCDHCYAEQWSYRLGCMGQKDYQGLHVETSDGSHRWNGVVRCLPEKLAKLCHEWRGKNKRPSVIGLNFLSDTFHESVPNSFLCSILRGVRSCYRHRFLLLTKRAARMRQFFLEYPNTLPNNLALGVSCSTQEDYDKLIPDLLATPVACRIISFEPFLEGINIKTAFARFFTSAPTGFIIGCESGPKARLVSHGEIRFLMHQAKAYGFKVYLKQICSNPDGTGKLLKDPTDIARVCGSCPRELPKFFNLAKKVPCHP